MKHIGNTVITLFAATVLAAPTFAAVITYNPSTEFSPTSNPNGVWTYGYSSSLGGPMIPYDQTYTNSSVDFQRHDLGSGAPGIANNPTFGSISLSTAVYPAQAIVLHPGPDGEYSILRFTAPADGNYSIQGFFWGTDVNSTTTNVAIQENGSSFFTGDINGYGFSTAKVFGDVKALSAGDTIDFAVGYGSNNNHLYDSTALNLTIIQNTVPEPTTPLLGGIGSLLLLRRKRHASC